jgi:DNA-binding Lrp family transcriptional regulator
MCELSFPILISREWIMQIDDTDRRILRQLLADPGLATADLASRAGVTPATCWRRLERLAGGIIHLLVCSRAIPCAHAER